MKKAIVATGILASSMLLGTSAYAAEVPAAPVNPDGSKIYVNYPMDEASQARLSEKMMLADMYDKVKAGKIDSAVFDKLQAAFEKKLGLTSDYKATLGDEKGGTGITYGLVSGYTPAYSAKYITSLLQEPQQTYYWCGPATVAEIVKSKGVSLTQSQAASYMGTTTDGTDWNNGTYPVRDALNHYLNTSYYEPYGTSVSASVFKTNLAYDIDHGWGIAGDAYEVVGGPHLVGHPNSNIFHWFAIDGYSSYADSTHYADSVSGATSISWSGNVPQYSTMSTSTIAVICDGRGFIL
jgi:Peptidase_C39 like family